MATLVLHHATLETPAEYLGTAPVFCATCRAEHDEEDDYKETFDYLGKLVYCSARLPGQKERTCYAVAAEASYREQAANMLRNSLSEAMEEIDEVAADLDVELDDESDPRVELDNLLKRLPRFAGGRDTGYRGDFFLSQSELCRLQADVSMLLSYVAGIPEASRTAMDTLSLLSTAERRSEGKL